MILFKISGFWLHMLLNWTILTVTIWTNKFHFIAHTFQVAHH